MTNDWSIEPENIMILPDCVNSIDVTPTGYRAVNRDFSNASRNHATAGTPSNPANWTTNTAKADSLSGSCLESNTQSPGILVRFF